MKNILKRKLYDNEVVWLAYYLFILFSMILVTQPDVKTSMIIRYSYVLVVFIPTLIRKELFPFAVVCFCAISRQSFSPILPSAPTIYLGITLLFFAFNFNRIRMQSDFVMFLIIVLYFIISCYLRYDVQGFIRWLIIAVVLCSFINDKKSIYLLGIAMIYASLFLSLLFLIFQNSFVADYDAVVGDDLERIGWINPNEFGASIACGLVISAGYLLNIVSLPKTMMLKTICYTTIVISTVTLLLNASRGCVVASAVAIVLFVLLSNKTKRTKWFLLICIVGIVILIMQSTTFALFINRIQDAESMRSGSGRVNIWEIKLQEFSLKSFGSLLIGIGQKECGLLGGVALSTHNDFVTALIGYGLIGLCLLLYVLILPLRKMVPKNRAAIIPMLVFLFVECIVMEPFFRGNLQFYMFYVFVLLYAEASDKESINNKCE